MPPKAKWNAVFGEIDAAITGIAPRMVTVEALKAEMLHLNAERRSLQERSEHLLLGHEEETDIEKIEEDAKAASNLNAWALQKEGESIKKLEQLVENYQLCIKEISEALDAMNALNRNGLPSNISRQRAQKRIAALNKLTELKSGSSIFESLLAEKVRNFALNSLITYKEKVLDNEEAHGTSGVNPKILPMSQKFLSKFYTEQASTYLFGDHETSLDLSFIVGMNDEDTREHRANASEGLEDVIDVLMRFRIGKLNDVVGRMAEGGEEPAHFDETVAELDILAKYARQRMLIEEENDLHVTSRDHFESLGVKYQIKGLHAKAKKAAQEINDEEIKAHLIETTTYFSRVLDGLQNCFGEDVTKVEGDNDTVVTEVFDAITKANIKRETFPDTDRQVILETLADVYADLSIQYRQFEQRTSDPKSKDLFEQMIHDAEMLESRMRRGLTRLEENQDVAPDARAKILETYGLTEVVRQQTLAISGEEEQVKPEVTKGEGKKTPALSASSNERVQKEAAPPVSAVKAEASLRSQEQEAAKGELRKLDANLQSLGSKLSAKGEEFDYEMKKVSPLQDIPARRNNYSPDLLAIYPRGVAVKAKSMAALCGQLADLHKQMAALKGSSQKDLVLSEGYARQQEDHNRTVSTYERIGETWRLERTKVCLANDPNDKLLNSIPDEEIKNIKTERLTHPTVAKNEKGIPLFAEGNVPLFDLVVEDTVTLKGSKQFVIHRHFQTTNEDATKKDLLEKGAGRLVAHSLKTTANARLGRGYKEPKAHLRLHSPDAVREAAEAVDNRLRRVGEMLKRGRHAM